MMDSERFDRVVRGLVDGSTRRTALLAGVATLAASAVAALGLGDGFEAEARKKKKRKKKRPKPPPPPGCTDDENFCLGASPCGSGCACAAGTEGTICAKTSDGLCFVTRDMCQVDADCDEFTGPGSVCIVIIGTCTCGDIVSTGFNGCVPPCGANRAAPRGLAASSLRGAAVSGGN